jgi:hypothetical protein
MVVPKLGTNGPQTLTTSSRTPSTQAVHRTGKGKAPQRHSNVAHVNGASVNADDSGPQFSDDVVFVPVSPGCDLIVTGKLM